jgi:protein O-GlcNAc transferase
MMGDILSSATEPVSTKDAQRLGPRRRRRTFLVVIGIILGLGIAVAAWWIWPTNRDSLRQPPTIPMDSVDADLRQAILTARERVLNEPNSAKAWGELGMWFAHQDRSAEAEECFIQAERLDPQDPHWPLYRAQTLERAGKPQEALISLRRAVALHTTASAHRTVANLRLAEALLEGESRAEAEEILESELLLSPSNPRAKFDLGLVALGRRDLRKAKEVLSSLIDSPFARKKSKAKLALIARMEGDDAVALRYEQQSREAPKDKAWGDDPYEAEGANLVSITRTRIAEVEALRRQGRTADANLAVLQMAQKEATAHAWLMAGVHFLEGGLEEQAQRCFQKSLQIDPDYVPTLYSLAYMYFREGETLNRTNHTDALARFRESDRCARRCIAVKPDHGYAYLVLGRSLIFLKQNSEAVQHLRIAVKCRPDLADAHLYFAEALWQSGKNEESRQELKIARDLGNPKDLRQKDDMERISQLMNSNIK